MTDPKGPKTIAEKIVEMYDEVTERRWIKMLEHKACLHCGKDSLLWDYCMDCEKKLEAKTESPNDPKS